MTARDKKYKKYVQDYFKSIDIELPKNTLYQDARFKELKSYCIEIAKIVRGKRFGTGLLAEPRPEFVFVGEYDKGFLIDYSLFKGFIEWETFETDIFENRVYIKWGRGRAFQLYELMTHFVTKDKPYERKTK